MLYLPRLGKRDSVLRFNVHEFMTALIPLPYARTVAGIYLTSLPTEFLAWLTVRDRNVETCSYRNMM
jgi:hypothetical protein